MLSKSCCNNGHYYSILKFSRSTYSKPDSNSGDLPFFVFGNFDILTIFTQEKDEWTQRDINLQQSASLSSEGNLHDSVENTVAP